MFPPDQQELDGDPIGKKFPTLITRLLAVMSPSLADLFIKDHESLSVHRRDVGLSGSTCIKVFNMRHSFMDACH